MRTLNNRALKAVVGATTLAAMVGGTAVTLAAPASAAVKDGTYTGAVSKANKYTPTTVTIVVKGGKVVKVNVKVSPKDGDSVVINKIAIPKLTKTAIAKQSSKKVANVTGASLTSTAFKQSLQSALTKAGIKG